MYDEKQVALLDAAVRAVARDGLEKTTTRSIGAVAGINDAYIYRCFKDKEDLLSQAYILVNERMVSLAARVIREVRVEPDVGSEQKFVAVVHRLWEQLTLHPDACIFCNYYYHSASYKKYAGAQHHELIARLLEALRENYIVHEQAEAAIYYLMESIIGFVSKVIDGIVPDSEAYFDMAVARLYPIFQSAASPK